MTLECGRDPTPPDVTDICGTATIGFVDGPVTGNPCNQLVTRTWTATDECGNTSTCQQAVTLVDTTRPVITCPPSLTVECLEVVPPTNFAGGSVSDNCRPNPIVQFLFDSRVSGSILGAQWLITRTYEANDQCGNTSRCTQVILVKDTIPPEITCPPNVTVQCGDDTTPAGTGSAIATDNCSGVNITFADGSSGTCPEVITRTWTARDVGGNTAECVQTITVEDNTPPEITFCPDDVTVACDDETIPANTGGSATGTDVCGAVDVMYADSPGGDCPQAILRIWTARDLCGNESSCLQTITRQDSIPPVITCPPAVTVECADEVPAPDFAGGSVTDNCNPNPTVTHLGDAAVGFCPTIITRTYVATDACGNQSQCAQTITVDDTQDPVIACPADVTVECGDDTSSAGTGMATATDNCDNDVTIEESETEAAGSCPGEKVITRTWTATDDCGNQDSCEQTIAVVDTTPPGDPLPHEHHSSQRPGSVWRGGDVGFSHGVGQLF